MSTKVVKSNTRNTPPQQLSVGDEVKKLKRTIQAMAVGFGGIVLMMVGMLVLVTNEPVEGSPSPGTCLPLDKGGTGCEVLPVASGGTGADSADGARSNILLDYPAPEIEQDTGTKWIDGKTVYRRTFTGTVTAAAEAEVWRTLFSGVDTLINSGGTIQIDATAWNLLGQSRSNGAIYSMIQLNASTGNVAMSSRGNQNRTNAAYKVWIEYTKL